MGHLSARVTGHPAGTGHLLGFVELPTRRPRASSSSENEFPEVVARATKKLERVELTTHPPLAASERAQLAEALRRKLPRFGDRALTAKITDVGAQYFRFARILRVESATPFPAQAAHAAWLSAGPVVLSGDPSELAHVNAEERSVLARDADLAVALLSLAGVWTGASLLSEVRLRNVDDIPFRRATPDDQTREAEIRQRFASQIAPPLVERFSDGLSVTMWIVSESWLRRRRGEVRDGAVYVTEDALTEVPAFPGRMWGVKNKRFVPIG